MSARTLWKLTLPPAKIIAIGGIAMPCPDQSQAKPLIDTHYKWITLQVGNSQSTQAYTKTKTPIAMQQAQLKRYTQPHFKLWTCLYTCHSRTHRELMLITTLQLRLVHLFLSLFHPSSDLCHAPLQNRHLSLIVLRRKNLGRQWNRG